jgi:S1-C subfamily serine protease
MRFLSAFSLCIILLCLLPFHPCLASSSGAESEEQGPAASQPGDLVAAVVQLVAVGPGPVDKNRECAATGFLVNEQGYILTNAHVVEDARRCLAGSAGGKIMAKLARPEARAAKAVSCDVIVLDDRHDLALLKTERPLPEGKRRSFARLDSRKLPDGTQVSVIGHPGFAWHPVTQSGRVLRHAPLDLSDATMATSETTETLVLDMPLHRGNSGSPVYLPSSGGVVAVVERRFPARPEETVAVPIRYAIDLLDRHGVRWYPSAQ